MKRNSFFLKNFMLNFSTKKPSKSSKQARIILIIAWVYKVTKKSKTRMKLDKNVQKSSSKNIKVVKLKLTNFTFFFLCFAGIDKIVSFLRCFRFSLLYSLQKKIEKIFFSIKELKGGGQSKHFSIKFKRFFRSEISNKITTSTPNIS